MLPTSIAVVLLSKDEPSIDESLRLLKPQCEAVGATCFVVDASEKRLDGMPSLPTAREQGFNVVVTKFRGLAAPKGVPDAVAATWEAALKRVLELPAYKAEYQREHLIPQLMGRAEARKFTAQFAKETTDAFREMGLVK